jgi:small subunit ribosomal protein S29
MASICCRKCLLRPSVSPAFPNVPSRLPTVAKFSTTSALAVEPNKKKKAGQGGGPQHRKSTSLRVKRKAFVKTGKPPMPGERKAMRKRIVLSNTNALEVADMEDMTPTLKADQVGKVIGLPGAIVDQLRAVEAFKTTQGWGMFRRPGLLVRSESIEIVKIMEDAEAGKKTSRTIIDGERGAGKSLMLLQAMSTAYLNGWIVLNIPEGKLIWSHRIVCG